MELTLFVFASIFIVPAAALFMIGILITMYLNEKVKAKEKLKFGSMLGFVFGIICIIAGSIGITYIIAEYIKYLVN